jgi:hypothetical protein
MDAEEFLYSKKYILVDRTTIEKMLDTFGSSDEFLAFQRDLTGLSAHLYDIANTMKDEKDENILMNKVVAQLFAFGYFCRENIEIIRQWVQLIQYKELTKEEKEAIDSKIISQEE